MNLVEKNTVPAGKQLGEENLVRVVSSGKRGPRILFAGNSITLHGIKPEIGWNVCWGMAASAEEKDYVHVLMDKIREQEPEVSYCICQVGLWETRYREGEEVLDRYQEGRDFQADYIIMRCIENCSVEGFEPEIFMDQYGKLIRFLDGSGKAKVILTTGFWHHAGDEAIRRFAREKGYPAVELGDLGEDPGMRADGLFAHNGVAIHPGDLGMKKIAERIYQQMKWDKNAPF